MASGNIVTINNGGILTGTAKNNWLSSTQRRFRRSQRHLRVVNPGGTLKGADGNITGLGNVTLNGGTIEVTSGLTASAGSPPSISAATSPSAALRPPSSPPPPSANTSANFQMSNGSNGGGGTRAFIVNDVTNSSASDLVISARIANGTVVKQGDGTVEIAAGETGTGSPGHLGNRRW